jgi:hypothetical protein
MENRRRFISIINLEHPRTITQGIGFSNAQKQFPSKDLGLLTAIVNSIRARKTKRKRSANGPAKAACARETTSAQLIEYGANC